MRQYHFVIAALLALFSCSEPAQGPEGPQGLPGNPPAGSLVGFVTLYDEFGNMQQDFSGVKVSIETSGTELSALTNNIGRYQFDNLPMGTYNITFTKTGYYDYKAPGIIFPAGSKPVVLNATMSTFTTTEIEYFYVTGSATQMTVYLEVSPAIPAGRTRDIRLFCSRTDLVSPTAYIVTYSLGMDQLSRQTTITIDKAKFPSGSRIYIRAFPEPFYISSYQNPLTGYIIYPNLGTPYPETFYVNVP